MRRSVAPPVPGVCGARGCPAARTLRHATIGTRCRGGGAMTEADRPKVDLELRPEVDNSRGLTRVRPVVPGRPRTMNLLFTAQNHSRGGYEVRAMGSALPDGGGYFGRLALAQSDLYGYVDQLRQTWHQHFLRYQSPADLGTDLYTFASRV